MKKLFLPLISFLLLVSMQLFALQGEIVFVDGTVDIRSADGVMDYADFGTPVQEGDTIITGYASECEVSLPNGSTVKLSSDSVFTFQRGTVSAGGEPENVFEVARGQVSFKFNQLGSDEPSIRSRSATAGVRGTEFTVIAGADGQALFVISDGAVEVEAEGSSVLLGQHEAVEVSLSEGVGEKFPALEGEIDFSSWRMQADANALANPAATVVAMTGLLEQYLRAVESYRAFYEINQAREVELREQIAQLRAEGKTEEADVLVDRDYLPNKKRMLDNAINYRFYALSIQSLRRFVLADLYVSQRTAQLAGAQSPELDEFWEQYRRFTGLYEQRAIPFFVPADI